MPCVTLGGCVATIDGIRIDPSSLSARSPHSNRCHQSVFVFLFFIWKANNGAVKATQADTFVRRILKNELLNRGQISRGIYISTIDRQR